MIAFERRSGTRFPYRVLDALRAQCCVDNVDSGQ